MQTETSKFITLTNFLSNLTGTPQKRINQTDKNTIETLVLSGDLNCETIGGKEYLLKKTANQLCEELVSITEICSNAGISSQTIKKLIIKYGLSLYKFGKSNENHFMKKEVVKKYFYNDDYVNFQELYKKINSTNYAYHHKLMYSLLKQLEKDKLLKEILGYKKLEFPIYFNNYLYSTVDVFHKNKVKEFSESYVSVRKLFDETTLKPNNLPRIVKRLNVRIYSLAFSHDLKFIHTDDYLYLKNYSKFEKHPTREITSTDEYKKMLMNDKVYNTREVIKLLNLITNHHLKEILNAHNIEPLHSFHHKNKSFNYYSKNEIDNICNLQTMLYKKYKARYSNVISLQKEYPSVNIRSLLYQTDVKSIECPIIIRTLLDSHVLYDKKEIKKLIKTNERNNELKMLYNDRPFNDYIYKTENIVKSTFANDAQETEQIWNNYVRRKLLNISDKQADSKVNQFVRISKFLSQSLTKEIYLYSPQALNRIIFSPSLNTIAKTHQMQLYFFYKELSQKLNDTYGRKILDLSLINNPKYYNKIHSVDNKKYSFEEYTQLFRYTCDLKQHKIKAIEDVMRYIKGLKYSKYDSFWIYVMAHLTNNWRHNTIITEIPQVNLSDINVKNLEWLIDNDISLEDANKIIFQIGLSLKHISKTDVVDKFRISEPLKIPFATAVIIAQFRANHIKNLDNSQLLNLHIKNVILPHHTVHQAFFRNFNRGFKFSNRKMNKTLSTIIWSVTNDLNISKVSRAHRSEDSTKRYIDLDNKQLKFIIEQLFSNDSFGYINTLLTNTIFNDDTSVHVDNTPNLSIKNAFGDVQKINISMGIINRISTENDYTHNLITSMTNEEKTEILLKSMTNTLYTKQQYYQCVFSKCKFENEPVEFQVCSSCPYSIINVYALSNLMNIYLEKIDQLIISFEGAKFGEKQKLANQFYLIWRQIQQAKDKYGDAIYEFVDGGKKRFERLSLDMPVTKKFITINVGEES